MPARPLAFWPVVVVQSALAVWVLALTLRAMGLRNRPWLFVAIVAVLSILTTLPWLTSILLTDIFCVIGVLGLYLLLMHADVLNRSSAPASFCSPPSPPPRIARRSRCSADF